MPHKSKMVDFAQNDTEVYCGISEDYYSRYLIKELYNSLYDHFLHLWLGLALFCYLVFLLSLGLALCVFLVSAPAIFPFLCFIMFVFLFFFVFFQYQTNIGWEERLRGDHNVRSET